MYATGTGGTITGFGAGKHRDGFGRAIIIDDPHKADEAKSDTIRKGVIDWFQNTLESRKNSPETPIIVIMQRLHEDDLAGWLLGTVAKTAMGRQWPAAMARWSSCACRLGLATMRNRSGPKTQCRRTAAHGEG